MQRIGRNEVDDLEIANKISTVLSQSFKKQKKDDGMPVHTVLVIDEVD